MLTNAHILAMARKDLEVTIEFYNTTVRLYGEKTAKYRLDQAQEFLRDFGSKLISNPECNVPTVKVVPAMFLDIGSVDLNQWRVAGYSEYRYGTPHSVTLVGKL